MGHKARTGDSMNEAEASKKAQEMIEHRKQVFCPMINGQCEILCDCYKMPEVYLQPLYKDYQAYKKTDFYDVRHGFCTCYALKGASD